MGAKVKEGTVIEAPGTYLRYNVGGIWGWSDSGTPTLENCLEAGTYNNVYSMHPIGLQGNAGTITNCYYLKPQDGNPTNACTVSGAKQAYAFTTAPANLGELEQDYGTIKVYPHGILYNGTYYMAFVTISLADNSDNSTTISNADGYLADVTLSGRTLYKDGRWNTLCLPFDVVLDGSPLEGATARPLTSANITGVTLNLNFSEPVDRLKTGTPYIIKWTKGDDNIVNPVFSGVVIDATDRSYDNGESGDAHVRFLGTYKSVDFSSVDNSILLLGGSNMLYNPSAGASIGAQRAYFKLGDSSVPTSEQRVAAFSISIGGETTSINEELRMKNEESDGAWYSLDGRKLQGKPTQRGVYINNGHKVVIK